MTKRIQDVRSDGSGGARRWSFATSIGSILAAFVASLCCVGPLVFAILGIGGAGLLIKFEPYRPYFMMLTLALLGGGFYFTYRKPKPVAPTSEGDVDCACEYPKSNRAGRRMLWIATLLVAGLLTHGDRR